MSNRDEKIYEMRMLRTMTLKQIGQHFGISGHRVRIILMTLWRKKGRPPADIDFIAPRSGMTWEHKGERK